MSDSDETIAYELTSELPGTSAGRSAGGKGAGRTPDEPSDPLANPRRRVSDRASTGAVKSGRGCDTDSRGVAKAGNRQHVIAYRHPSPATLVESEHADDDDGGSEARPKKNSCPQNFTTLFTNCLPWSVELTLSLLIYYI
jgi:hypothetical protein